MISSTEFKAHFHEIFRLMRDTGLYLDVHSNGRLYRLHIEDLNQRVSRKHKGLKRVTYVDKVETERCPKCSKLMINNICMNPNCQ